SEMIGIPANGVGVAARGVGPAGPVVGAPCVEASGLGAAGGRPAEVTAVDAAAAAPNCAAAEMNWSSAAHCVASDVFDVFIAVTRTALASTLETRAGGAAPTKPSTTTPAVATAPTTFRRATP